MNKTTITAMLGCLLFVLLGFTPAVLAQRLPSSQVSFGGSNPTSKEVTAGIAWYGVLKDGLEAAKTTGKPILLVSAAPQCGGVPGMW